MEREKSAHKIEEIWPELAEKSRSKDVLVEWAGIRLRTWGCKEAFGFLDEDL